MARIMTNMLLAIFSLFLFWRQFAVVTKDTDLSLWELQTQPFVLDRSQNDDEAAEDEQKGEKGLPSAIYIDQSNEIASLKEQLQKAQEEMSRLRYDASLSQATRSVSQMPLQEKSIEKKELPTPIVVSKTTPEETAKTATEISTSDAAGKSKEKYYPLIKRSQVNLTADEITVRDFALYYPKLTTYNPPKLAPDQPQKVLISSLVFGPLVNSQRFRLFLESTKTAGEHFDFLIAGYPTPNYPLPPHVKHFKVTWNELLDHIVQKIFKGDTSGVQDHIFEMMQNSNGYRKCNDLKPLMAYLYPEVFEGYDWWGWCDNDALMGNLEKAFPQNVLRNSDIVCGIDNNGKWGTWGPFTLLRNVPEVNQLFFHAPTRGDKITLPKLLLNPSAYHFDENSKGGNNGIVSMAKTVLVNGTSMGMRFDTAKMDIVWDKGHCFARKPLPSKERCGECIKYKNGTLIASATGEEKYFCHYHKHKKALDWSLGNNTKLFDQLMESGNFNASAYGYSLVVEQ